MSNNNNKEGGKIENKIISYGPNNNINSFGYRMMCGMGWSAGKGLGTKEDGITDYIKVYKKADNRGIGADINTIDNWLENSKGFADVLSRLNAAYSTTEIGVSSGKIATKKRGEKRQSSETGKKYRYHKLLKAKTKCYSEVDIKEILGTKSDDEESSDENFYDVQKTSGTIINQDNEKSNTANTISTNSNSESSDCGDTTSDTHKSTDNFDGKSNCVVESDTNNNNDSKHKRKEKRKNKKRRHS